MIPYFEKISWLLLYFSDFFLKNRPWHVHLFCIFKIMQSHAWLKEKPKDFPLGNSVLGNILKSKDRLINAMILVNLRGQKSVIRKKLYLYAPKLMCSLLTASLWTMPIFKYYSEVIKYVVYFKTLRNCIVHLNNAIFEQYGFCLNKISHSSRTCCSRYNIFWGLLWANACKQAYVNACIPYIMENLTEKSVRCRWTISLDT